MADEKDTRGDLFGLKSLGDAAIKVIDGAGAFLGRICMPAAEELGFLLRDRVRSWRAANALKTTVQAEKLYANIFGEKATSHAHPRLAMQILEQGSWSEEGDIQAMWAGLLVSSCSPDGRDDSNIMFVDLLSKLTTGQARALNHVCASCDKWCSGVGLVIGTPVHVNLDKLKTTMGLEDIHRIDRELDHLRALGLLEPGSGFAFDLDPGIPIQLTPSALALQMHARVHGAANPMAFFDLKPGQGMPGAEK